MNRSSPCDCAGCEVCAPDYHGEDVPPRPPRCRACDRPIGEDDVWCDECRPAALARLRRAVLDLDSILSWPPPSPRE